MKDAKTRERFVELRGEGWSFDRISRELKVSKQTLVSWSKDLAQDIQNLRSIQLDALQERYQLAKAHRLLLFGEQLQRFRAELEKRDLSDVPTKELFAMMVRCAEMIHSDQEEVRFVGKTSFLEEDPLNKSTTWSA